MNDDKILITFEGVPAVQANELAKELRCALLDAAVEAKQSGAIEIEPAHDPHDGGNKGELVLRFATYIMTAMLLDKPPSNEMLFKAMAEILLLFAEKVHLVIKIKCSKEFESFEIKPQIPLKEIVNKWLNCLRKLAEKNSGKLQK